MSFRITELWAWVAIDPVDDDEGVVGFQPAGSRLMMPLIMADKARLDSIRHIAEDIAKHSGKTLKLIRVSVREDVETLVPPGKVAPS